MQDTSAKK